MNMSGYLFIFAILSFPFKTPLYLNVSYSKKGHHESVRALPELECDMEKTQNKLDCIVCFNNRAGTASRHAAFILQ